MSSRLLRSPSGRVVAVEVTSPLAGVEVGHRYRVLGDAIGVAGGGLRFMGESPGRPPLPEEASGPGRRHVARGRRRRSPVAVV